MPSHHTTNVQMTVVVQQSSVTVDKSQVQEIVGEYSETYMLKDGTIVTIVYPCTTYYF